MRASKPSKRRLNLEPLEQRHLLAAYAPVDLGFLPDAFDNYTEDINNAGQVVGQSGDSAMLWTPSSANDGTGNMTDLGVLPNHVRSQAEAISDNGWVVGYSYAPGMATPFVWIPNAENGQVGAMQAIDSNNGKALGVNDNGKVVGSLDDNGSDKAFIWEEDGGAVHLTDLNDLLTPSQLEAQGAEVGTFLYEARGINNNNQIIANGSYSNGGEYYRYGFLIEDNNGGLFDDGGGITVTNLGMIGDRARTYATDINDSGQIVGASFSPKRQNGSHAFLWEGGAIQDLGTLSRDPSSVAYGISDSGIIVGRSGDYSYADPDGPQAFMWQNGRMSDLNAELPTGSGWSLEDAKAVNDQGQIVGRGSPPGSQQYYRQNGYLLTNSLAVPTISISDATVLEGDTGTTPVALTITLSEPVPVGDTLTVDYSTVGANPGEDFVDSSGFVEFLAGQTSAVVTVEVMGDVLAGAGTHDTGDEYFLVNLDNPRNDAGDQTAVFQDAQGTVTILEDEPALYISDVEIDEGNAGLSDLTFTVTVENNADDTKNDIIVYWHTENNTAHDYGDPADGDPDYISVQLDNPAALVIPAGAASATFSVPVYGDTVIETGQVFIVRLVKGTVENAIIPDLDNRTGGFAYGIIANDDRKGGGGGGEQNAPVADDDNYSTQPDTTLTVTAPGMLGNDTDADGDSITAALATGPSSGTLVLSPDGSFTYTPNSGFTGTDSFTYVANDGTTDSNEATVTITVEAAPTNETHHGQSNVDIRDGHPKGTPRDTVLTLDITSSFITSIGLLDLDISIDDGSTGFNDLSAVLSNGQGHSQAITTLVSGTYSLTAFNTDSLADTWTLVITDSVKKSPHVLANWSLTATQQAAPLVLSSVLSNEQGHSQAITTLVSGTYSLTAFNTDSLTDTWTLVITDPVKKSPHFLANRSLAAPLNASSADAALLSLRSPDTEEEKADPLLEPAATDLALMMMD